MKKQNRCTKETILEEQKRLKEEPNMIDVKTWSYVLKEEKKQEKKQDYKKKKSTHKKQSRNVK